MKDTLCFKSLDLDRFAVGEVVEVPGGDRDVASGCTVEVRDLRK